MRDRWTAAFLFIGVFGFYLRQAAPSVTAGDSGEFITAAATLSIAHAPSFPLFMLLGKLFVGLVPWASVSYRVNVFSAFCSAGSLVLLFFIIRRLGASRTAAVLLALAAGVSASFWLNSLVTEVFALNTFLFCLLISLLLRKEFLLSVFVLGLGLGNHHVLLFGAPAALFYLWKENALGGKSIGFFLLMGLLGLSVYAALPVRARQHPPLNWGQPTTASKLYRTFTRQDYGTLKLALGEAPARTFQNAARQFRLFLRQIGREVPWPLWVLALAGMGVGFYRYRRLAGFLFLLVFFTGPFFIWLGNLPFTAQSEGIMGRFYIMPVLSLLLFIVFLFRDSEPKRLRRFVYAPILCLGVFLSWQRGWAEGSAHRGHLLVLDYGRSMLRAMPPGSILYMDGGDDAFYSLAMIGYAMNQRPDVDLHDRGGLVFKNPYGPDFRSLTKEQKKIRRQTVERDEHARRPLFYSTMDTHVLPGIPLVQRGFLYQARGPRESVYSWPLVCLRALYPPATSDYRTRALACFFPFMLGKDLMDSGRNIPLALAAFRRAVRIGFDVDWLVTNLPHDYAQYGYRLLEKNQLNEASAVYGEWIRYDPRSEQAHNNLGVVLERMGRWEEAMAQYHRAAEIFPKAVDPVYNLAVLAWRNEDWGSVIRYMEEVLKRDPAHPTARKYLEGARSRM